MKNSNKNKWLLRKVSGSRSKYSYKPDYADTRNAKSDDIENLPKRESIRKGHTFLDTSLVRRWLQKQVGRDFDSVYSEFLSRIQPKYLDEYRDCIYYYVDKKEDVLNYTGPIYYKSRPRFYIDPETNKLCKWPHTPRAKSKYIKSKWGYFSFWTINKWAFNHPKGFNILINCDKENFNSEQIESIGEYISKMEKLISRSYNLIDECLIRAGQKELLENKKEILSMHFENPLNLKSYYFLIRINEFSEYTWKVSFNNYNVENIVVKRIT